MRGKGKRTKDRVGGLGHMGVIEAGLGPEGSWDNHRSIPIGQEKILIITPASGVCCFWLLVIMPSPPPLPLLSPPSSLGEWVGHSLPRSTSTWFPAGSVITGSSSCPPSPPRSLAPVGNQARLRIYEEVRRVAILVRNCPMPSGS